MSVGEGTYIFGRLGCGNNAPFDTTTLRRNILYSPDAEEKLTAILAHESQQLVDHAKFNLLPKKPVVFAPFLMNDFLGDRIANAAVRIRRFALEFDQNGVIFDDGTREELDTVILATGYDIDYPFLEKGIVAGKITQIIW